MRERPLSKSRVFKEITGFNWMPNDDKRLEYYNCAFELMAPMHAPDFRFVDRILSVLEVEKGNNIRTSVLHRLRDKLASYQHRYEDDDMAPVFEKFLHAGRNPAIDVYRSQILELALGLMAEGARAVNDDVFDMAVRFYSRTFEAKAQRAGFYEVPFGLMVRAVKAHPELVSKAYMDLCVRFEDMPIHIVPDYSSSAPHHVRQKRSHLIAENVIIGKLQELGQAGKKVGEQALHMIREPLLALPDYSPKNSLQ